MHEQHHHRRPQGGVIDVSRIITAQVAAKPGKDQAGATKDPFPFGDISLVPNHECHLVLTGNHHRTIVTTTPGAEDAVEKSFPNPETAWAYCTQLARPTSLVGEGFVLYKTYNNKFALYASAPGDQNRNVWDVLNFHKLLGVKLDCLDLAVMDVLLTWLRFALLAEDERNPENFAKVIADQMKPAAHVAAIFSFQKENEGNVVGLARFKTASAFANELIRHFLQADRTGAHDVVAIIEAVRLKMEESSLSVFNAICSVGSLDERLARMRRLADVVRFTVNRDNCRILPYLLGVHSDDLPDSHPGIPVAKAFAPCDIVHVLIPYIHWFVEEENIRMALLEEPEEKRLDGTQYVATVDGASVIKQLPDYPFQARTHTTPSVAVTESGGPLFGFGDKRTAVDSVTFFANISFTPDVKVSVFDRPIQSNGRLVIAVFYDGVVAKKALEWKHKQHPSDETWEHALQPFVADFETWMTQLLVSPLSAERKLWFFHYLVTFRHLDTHTAPLTYDGDDEETISTATIAHCLAKCLPIVHASQFLTKAIGLPIAIASNCERRNNVSGVILRATNYHYNDAGMLKATTNAEHWQSDADVYRSVVGRFTELVTHVEVYKLGEASNRLLKWFVEYTLRFPWRFIVLRGTNTTHNLPEVWGRLLAAPGFNKTTFRFSNAYDTCTFGYASSVSSVEHRDTFASSASSVEHRDAFASSASSVEHRDAFGYEVPK